ncbi:MAG: hypothetical protein FJ368_05920 [Pelagibacterales bacterium]|nr:hypothetical protein [Pelagibacterales bacterium]
MELGITLEEKIVGYLNNYKNDEEVLLSYVRESARLIQDLLKNDTEIDIYVTEDVEFINNSSGHHNSYIDSYKETTNYFFKEFELVYDEEDKDIYFHYDLLINFVEMFEPLEDKRLFEVLNESDLKINWNKILFHYSFIKCVFEKVNEQLTSDFIFESIRCFYGQNLSLKDVK